MNRKNDALRGKTKQKGKQSKAGKSCSVSAALNYLPSMLYVIYKRARRLSCNTIHFLGSLSCCKISLNTSFRTDPFEPIRKEAFL